MEEWIQSDGDYNGNEPPYAERDLAPVLPHVPESLGFVPLQAWAHETWAHETRSLGVPHSGAIESLLLVEAITIRETASDVALVVEWDSSRRSDLATVDPNMPVTRHRTNDRRKEIWARSVPA